jgi:hypothetical protein
MFRGTIDYMNRLLIIACVGAVLSAWGCAVFAPKVPVYKSDALNEVFWADEGFAAELAKVPGANSGDPRMSAAVSALWADYHGGRFADAFGRIMSVGNAEARAYCSPLEALLWLYEEDPAGAREILAGYSLDDLLTVSWRECNGDRWDEWEEIRARLSAPALCAYYTKNALHYIPERNDGKNYLQSPYETILMKGGDCEDFAALIVEALEYGGWYARLFTVDILRDPKKLPESHTVAAYRDAGAWYFIQGYEGKYLAGGINGPFGQANDVADFIAGSIGGQTYYYYIDTALEFLEAYKALNRGKP